MINFKEMSNAEIRAHEEKLKNEYEVIKNQIKLKFERLDELDKEYNNAESELNNRKRSLS